MKVISGKITPDSQLMDMRTGNMERIGKIVMMRGKKQEDAAAIVAGDIGAVLKLSGVNTGDTLCAPARKVVLDGITYPNATLTMAVCPKNKGEEDKAAQGIFRLVEEDPSIHYVNDAETRQMLLSGLGEQHLDVVVSKLRSKFGVEVELKQPKVAYRETIRKKVSVQGRHKKADRRPRPVWRCMDRIRTLRQRIHGIWRARGGRFCSQGIFPSRGKRLEGMHPEGAVGRISCGRAARNPL